MNINSVGTVMVLAKNSREGNNRQMYYNLAIFADGSAGNISCTQEAYDKAVLNVPNDVVFAYNEQYKSFRITDIIPPRYEPENLTDSTDTKPDTADTKASVRTDKPDSKPDKPSGAK